MKNILLSLFSTIIIAYISIQSGYFDVEHASINVQISKVTAQSDSLLYSHQSLSNYIGFPDSRIHEFESEHKTDQVKYLFNKLRNDSRYHEWNEKSIDITLHLRELNRAPKDTFTVRVLGSITGFCSPQSARELTQLFLAHLEYGLVEPSK